MSTYWKLRYLVYGTGMTLAVLVLAWFLNAVFERSLAAIALIMLAMLVVTLLHRMIAGGIPERPLPRGRREDDEPSDIREETRYLPGVNYSYGWMALPPALAAFVVVATMFL